MDTAEIIDVRLRLLAIEVRFRENRIASGTRAKYPLGPRAVKKANYECEVEEALIGKVPVSAEGECAVWG